MSKPRSTCDHEGCIGWLEELYLHNEYWTRCMSCGHMKRLIKRTVKVLIKENQNK